MKKFKTLNEARQWRKENRPHHYIVSLDPNSDKPFGVCSKEEMLKMT